MIGLGYLYDGKLSNNSSFSVLLIISLSPILLPLPHTSKTFMAATKLRRAMMCQMRNADPNNVVHL